MVYNFTTDQFDWNDEDYQFSQEASTLNFSPGEYMPKYFTVKNPKTNVEICFKLVDSIDTDDEVLGWEYKFFSMYNGTSTDKPVKDLKITIWND
jgi:hypothetical protein